MGESVWDYPRPPACEVRSCRVHVEAAGVVLVDDSEAIEAVVIKETSHPPVYYLPPIAVRMNRLIPSQRRGTICEWKGRARYWDLVTGDGRIEAIAWSYPDPVKRYAALRDHLAFYPSKLDLARIDGQQVAAQAGDFYGGWITPDIEGPFKGEPGTMGW